MASSTSALPTQAPASARVAPAAVLAAPGNKKSRALEDTCRLMGDTANVGSEVDASGFGWLGVLPTYDRATAADCGNRSTSAAAATAAAAAAPLLLPLLLLPPDAKLPSRKERPLRWRRRRAPINPHCTGERHRPRACWCQSSAGSCRPDDNALSNSSSSSAAGAGVDVNGRPPASAPIHGFS